MDDEPIVEIITGFCVGSKRDAFTIAINFFVTGINATIATIELWP